VTQGENDTAGVIAPPPLIFLGGLAIGMALDYAWPVWPFPGAARLPAGLLLGALGIAVAVGGIRRLRGAGTPVDPRRPTSALVVTGLYRWSRNPLYLAQTALYLGLAAGFGGAWALAMLAPVLAILYFGVIAREERYLETKFGEDYRHYKASVRRWL